MTHWNGGGGWSSAWMVIAMAVPLVLLVASGLAVALWAGKRPPRDDGGSEAPQILRARFARGEVDEEEFRSRLAVLTGVAQTSDVGRPSGGR